MPQVYKTIFMLKSAEHKIYIANKTQITYNCKIFHPVVSEHKIFSANKCENATPSVGVNISISSENFKLS